LNSYVPVVLEQARVSSTMIGILISGANAASVVGSALTGWGTMRGARLRLVVGVLATGLGLGAAGPLAELTLACAVALIVSGLGAGALQTVGPAIAADSVHPEERGEAIASAGLFRAGALFVAPLGMAALVTVMPMAPAMVTAGVLITAPALTMRALGRGRA
jgi:MFS family permease